MATNSGTLNAQIREMLENAERKGVSTNVFFKTTMGRYVELLEHMKELQGVIKSEGPTISKEYVKGRKNLVVNPAYAEYNKAATAANQTVTTLINIISKLSEAEGGGGSESFDRVLARLANDLGDGD